MAEGAVRKRDPVWEYFNEVPLPMGKAGIRAKCKQCNKEMQGLVAQMKQHKKCCDERTMFEEAGPSVISSAGVERIFSSFGLVHSKLRNHLGPDKARKRAFLFQIMNKQENEDENE